MSSIPLSERVPFSDLRPGDVFVFRMGSRNGVGAKLAGEVDLDQPNRYLDLNAGWRVGYFDATRFVRKLGVLNIAKSTAIDLPFEPDVDLDEDLGRA